MNKLIAVAVVIGALSSAWPALALSVAGAESSLNFISIKKGKVAELNAFTRFNGELTQAGRLQFSVDLASVDTGVDIRDERMRQYFFETARFPRADYSAGIDVAPIEALQPGQQLSLVVDGELSLHGAVQPQRASLRVTRLADGALQVTTAEPMLISLDAFALVEGAKKLQELVGLPSITEVVPVYFRLVLR